MLTKAQADLIYGMLTQRLYLREVDPEKTLVQDTRNAVYPYTTSCAEYKQAMKELS